MIDIDRYVNLASLSNNLEWLFSQLIMNPVSMSPNLTDWGNPVSAIIGLHHWSTLACRLKKTLQRCIYIYRKPTKVYIYILGLYMYISLLVVFKKNKKLSFYLCSSSPQHHSPSCCEVHRWKTSFDQNLRISPCEITQQYTHIYTTWIRI